MRKIFLALMLVLATATASQAQDRVATDERTEPAQRGEFGKISRKVTDKKFWLVAGALNTAMLLDTKSTFDVTTICPDCEEANPFAAPFVRRGPAVTYVAGELFDAGVMTIAARMRGSDRAWMRRTWWVMPVALVVGHSIAYRHNVTLFR